MHMGLLAIAVVLAWPAFAFAQMQPQRAPSSQPRLQGAEQRVEDLSRLGVSLRSLQTDLRQPSGFESVYRVSGDEGAGDRFMRVDGALTATFRQSEYSPVYVRERFMLFFSRERKIGYVPDVPAGTVFRIGSPPGLHREDGEGPPRSQPQWHVAQQPAARRAEIGAMTPTQVIDAPIVERNAREAKAQANRVRSTDTTRKNAVVETTSEESSAAPMAEERLRELLRRAVDRERAARG